MLRLIILFCLSLARPDSLSGLKPVELYQSPVESGSDTALQALISIKHVELYQSCISTRISIAFSLEGHGWKSSHSSSKPPTLYNKPGFTGTQFYRTSNKRWDCINWRITSVIESRTPDF